MCIAIVCFPGWDVINLKAFFIIFKGLSVAKNCLRPESAPLKPKSLQIKKHSAFQPVSKDFNIKWNNILWGPERNLVELLL